MAAKQITRASYPRYKSGNNFTTFRARSLNAFAAAATEGLLAQIAKAVGMTLEEGLTTLEQAYPIPIPMGGFRPAKQPRVFDKMSERTIRGGTLPWQAGFAEEIKKLARPGPVASIWSMPNIAEQFGSSAQALVDQLLVERLLAGDTGTHEYDDAAFFGTTKKIAPDSDTSDVYDNKIAMTLDPSNPIAFVKDLQKRVKRIPHPGATANATRWMQQELAAVLCSTDVYSTLEDVANKQDIRVTVDVGGDAKQTIVESNPVRGKFTPIESNHMPDDKAIAFCRGVGAQAPFLVHTLTGIEELPGGDFMAPEAWQAETGTFMLPRIWELGNGSEYARLNGLALIGADMDVDMILYAPWSVFMIDLTVGPVE